MPNALIEELSDTHRSLLIQFLQTGVLQELYLAQLSVLNQKLRIPNNHMSDEELVRHIRQLQHDHHATLSTIEILNGYID